MKRGLFLFALLLLCGGIHAEESWHRVQKVYDGDTILLKGGEKVRFLGIDTPELHPSDKLYRDAARSRRDARKIQELGALSYEVTRKLLQERQVRLQLDETTKDRYGRTLAYVYFKLSEGRFFEIVGQKYTGKSPDKEREYMLNRELIRYGWASAYKNFSYKKKKEFLKLERKAREEGLGLWKQGGSP